MWYKGILHGQIEELTQMYCVICEGPHQATCTGGGTGDEMYLCLVCLEEHKPVCKQLQSGKASIILVGTAKKRKNRVCFNSSVNIVV